MTSPTSNPLFRRSEPVPVSENPYVKFGLSQNPFPDKPFIVPESNDPRLNGEIYQADLRSTEEAQFERLLIPRKERPEVRPVALLMDYATRRGRGIGKTAFLNHQRRRIMRDLGGQLTNGSFVLLAAQITPDPAGNTRKFWQFTQQIADALNSGNCIAWALWRLRAVSGVIPDEVLSKVNPENPESTLGDDQWLEEHDVGVLWNLNPTIERVLRRAGVSEQFAKPLAYLGATPTSFAEQFLNRMKDSFWRQQGLDLVFDDLVRLFRAAEINSSVLLVDEVENIVGPQNSQERRAFVSDMRRFFIDGPFQSVYTRFYSLLLTIHPYVQELWTPHWKAAGLDRVCPISGGAAQEFTIYFQPLDAQNTAVPLVLAYLDHFRINDVQKGQLAPFDAEAVIEALKRAGGVPGPMLNGLHLVLERAVQEHWEQIHSDQVRTIYETEIPAEPPSEDGVSPLTPAKIDLQGGG